MSFFTMLTRIILFSSVLLWQCFNGDLIVNDNGQRAIHVIRNTRTSRTIVSHSEKTDYFSEKFLRPDSVVILSMGGDPHVVNMTPNASITRTTFLYSTPINILVTGYEYPLNSTHKNVKKVVDGNTTINSTDYCIAYGRSFDLWNQIPIQYPDETGNGGCDALWGRKCSQSILQILLESSLTDINNPGCGVPIPDILTKPPLGCPTANVSSGSMGVGAFLINGTFSFGGSSLVMNLSQVWSFLNVITTDNDYYDELMKYHVFIFFVGRSYSENILDAGIACLTNFNKTDGSNSSVVNKRRSECFFITLLIMITSFNIKV